MKFLLAFVDKFCDEHTHHTHDFSLELGQVTQEIIDEADDEA